MAAAPKLNQPTESTQSIATPAQAVSVSIQHSPILDFWDEQSQEATADLHPPLFQDLNLASKPRCPKNCQAPFVQLPRTWRRCTEFQCSACGAQWEVWDNEDAKETEPHGFRAWELARLAAEKAKAEVRAQEEAAQKANAIVLARAFLDQAAPVQQPTTESKALPTASPDTAPSEMISFTRIDGNTLAKCPYSNQQLHNTYQALWPILGQVRTAILQSKISSWEKLRDMFKGALLGKVPLGKAADDSDWKNWIEVFASDPEATPKNISKVFLKDKTSLQISTITTMISTGRPKAKD